MSKNLFWIFWLVGIVLMFLYSYTQVDLSLTLSRASFLQDIQKGFQYIGWFNRPLSTYIYSGVFIFLFILYFWAIQSSFRNTFTRNKVWMVILVTTGILTLSYNAFSYDIFNYIFDAKIVTHYHQNPYIHKALDFPQDPMLSFMRWTHRIYPYGPVWLGVTIPLSFIGGNIFIVTYFLFKILMSLSFLLTVWSIEKIARYLKYKNTLVPVIVFALNPYVLSESLVSAHNDIVMMGIGMVGVYYLLRKQHISGVATVGVSAGIKFVTIIIPAIYFGLYFTNKMKYFLLVCLMGMIGGIVLATLRTTFQPWYLLYAAPFAALMFQNKLIRLPIFICSIGAVMYYVPFLYLGNWDPPIPIILNWILITCIALSILSMVVLSIKNIKK